MDLKNRIDYSKYKCPYSHLEKEFKHELYGPEGYATDSVWCPCGFRGPASYLDPKELKLEPKFMSEKCFKCRWRKTFISRDNNNEGLELCIVEPYEENDDIVTWLDISKFDSSNCIYFKEI